MLTNVLDIVNGKLAYGFHLGQVYCFTMEEMDTLTRDPEEHSMHVHMFNKFDAHTRPITGVLVNEDSSKCNLHTNCS